ncbi:MAG: PTS sugar transporter subunit IIA [Erysipelotrichaceae bacterium]|nr:PTS sugar transporter subunit IIA [Erysipelotrichaceae bacterium]MDY5251392.1 PTS sugar transporter subunit IIA [Erysipelotrichaceae bacterium]
MRNNKANDILNYFIKNKSLPLTLDELSTKFGISRRQITNYIKQLNHDVAPEKIIDNDKNGKYFLVENFQKYLSVFEIKQYSPKNRVSVIISSLLTNPEVDIFDLADNLYVSRPTVEADITKIKKIINEFNLKITINDNMLTMHGEEKDKRRLTSFLIANEKYGNFNIDNTYLNSSYQTNIIKDNIKRIFDECHFIYNDYSLNNIILHILIIIDRLKNHNSLYDVLPSNLVTDIEKHATFEMVQFLEDHFNITFPEDEINNLMLFLSCNLATVDYNFISEENLNTYITDECAKLTSTILEKINNYYYIDNFDNIFITRFSLHINNLLKRIKANTSAHNPLKNEIMLSYPLVYDISAFIADIIYDETGYIICDDEISLIALHIGGFMESVQKENSLLTAIYIYVDYHGFYKYNIEKIQKKFEDKIKIKYSISISDYDPSKIQADLILSEASLNKIDAILISPFIKNEEYDLIEAAIKKLSKQKDINDFNLSLEYLFKNNLFFYDICGEDKFATINLLLEQIEQQDYFDQEFILEVIKREKVSSTCFHNYLAIPHAISQKVKNSFISICTYETPIQWDSEKVKIIILIGIAYHERKIFRDVFNKLVEILSSEGNINVLSKANTYDQYIECLKVLLANNSDK